MNKQRIVRLSNLIGLVSIILLVYWVFIFISVQVFGLKVFRENITETFYLSVFGILALMGGALMINIMMNLTIMADKHQVADPNQSRLRKTRKLGIVFALSFPLIFGLLFAGDKLSSEKKKQYLLQSAKQLINNYPDKTDALLAYHFDTQFLNRANSILTVMSASITNFQSVSVIVSDSIGDMHVFLDLSRYYDSRDTTPPEKTDFIYRASDAETTYLKSVFESHNLAVRFSANNGTYELFYPVAKGNKILVFYFNDRQRYGKIGS